jgi:DNA-binding Xre family transcriptional regulator
MRNNKRGAIILKSDDIILNLAPLFAARQIVHPYKFLLKLGISNTCTNKMINYQCININLRQLSILCNALECTPNDLFAVPKQNLPPNHPLQKLADVQDKLTADAIAQWLKTKSVDEVRKMMDS